MSTVAKILVVVNLILAGAFLASASNFLGQQETWKTRHDKAVEKLTMDIATERTAKQNLQGQYNDLEGQARATKEQNTGLDGENKTLRAQNDLLKQELTETSSQLTRGTAALQKAQDTIQSQRGLIDSLGSERSALAEAIRAANDQKEAAIRSKNEKEVQFDALLAEKQQLETVVEDLRNKVRAAELTAQNALAQMPPGADVVLEQPAHMGQVLMVDGDIAVISLGEEDGVKPGFRYTVSRGRDFVAVIEITDVQAKQSAGTSIRGLQKTAMRAGDRVLTAR